MTRRLETYLRELRDIRNSGAGVNEISYHHPLANLLNELGKPLKPKVRCIMNLKNHGAGIHDGGLFTADQLNRTAADTWHAGQIPNRGVLEVKGTGEGLVALTASAQVAKYLQRYGLILVTNLRDFSIVAKDAQGQAAASAAPNCTSTRFSASASACVTAGTVPTRFSSIFTSFGVPTIMVKFSLLAPIPTCVLSRILRWCSCVSHYTPGARAHLRPRPRRAMALFGSRLSDLR